MNKQKAKRVEAVAVKGKDGKDRAGWKYSDGAIRDDKGWLIVRPTYQGVGITSSEQARELARINNEKRKPALYRDLTPPQTMLLTELSMPMLQSLKSMVVLLTAQEAAAVANGGNEVTTT